MNALRLVADATSPFDLFRQAMKTKAARFSVVQALLKPFMELALSQAGDKSAELEKLSTEFIDWLRTSVRAFDYGQANRLIERVLDYRVELALATPVGQPICVPAPIDAVLHALLEERSEILTGRPGHSTTGPSGGWDVAL